MAEPCCALLLTAHEGNPLIAAPTKAFPDIGVAVHPPRVLRLLEWTASGGADTMCE